MATIDVASAQAQNLNFMGNNPYAMGQGSMAHDYFGSKWFGQGYSQTFTGAQPAMSSAPVPQGSGTMASEILQQYCASQGGSGIAQAPQAGQFGMPTIQQQYAATQIANMFSGNVPMFCGSSFASNDLFAQQRFSPAGQQGLAYLA